MGGRSEAIYLFDDKGYTINQLSEITGINPHTVRKWIYQSKGEQLTIKKLIADKGKCIAQSYKDCFECPFPDCKRSRFIKGEEAMIARVTRRM